MMRVSKRGGRTRRETQRMALGTVIIRIMVQIAIPVVRAFGVAFQQALVNAKKGGVDAAASTATVRRGGMRVDEALKVLNLEKELLAKPASEASGELEKQFERYFASNDPEKGGSFYLQSKVRLRSPRVSRRRDASRPKLDGAGALSRCIVRENRSQTSCKEKPARSPRHERARSCFCSYAQCTLAAHLGQ